MQVSSSNHTLSADNGLSLPNKIKWFYLNFRNNLYPNRDSDPELDIKSFHSNDLSFEYEGFQETVSPARYLCNLFWKEFLFDYSKELDGTIKALEIGCGSGVYGQLMHQIMPERLEYSCIISSMSICFFSLVSAPLRLLISPDFSSSNKYSVTVS